MEPAALVAGFASVAADFDMEYDVHDLSRKTKVVIMVSRFGHCLNDLLYRSHIGALPVEIVAVISNHLEYQKQVVNEDIPFHHIRVTPETKPEAEAAILQVVRDAGAELVVLARYMQVLSERLCQKCLAASSTSTTPSCLPSRAQTLTSRPMSAACD